MSRWRRTVDQLLHEAFPRLLGSRPVSGAAIYVTGNVLQKGIGFLLIPVYTTFLAPGEYGIAGYVLALSAVVVHTLSLGLHSAIVRQYVELGDRPDRLKTFVSTNLLFVASFGLIVIVLMLWFGEGLWLSVTSGKVPFRPYVQIGLLFAYFSLVSLIPFSLLRAQERATAYTAGRLTQVAAAVIGALVFVVYFQLGAVGQLLGLLTSSVVGCLLVTGIVAREWIGLRFSRDDLHAGLSYGLPLVPYLVLGWAIGFIDRLLLEPRVSLDELGLYNLAYQVGLAMSIVVVSINMAWVPFYFRVMKHNKRPEELVRKVVKTYVGVVGTLCLAAVLFAQPLISTFTTDKYHAAAAYAPLILIGYLLNGYYYFASAPVHYRRQTKRLPWIALAAVSVNIALNLLLIPTMGVLGAAWATAAAFFTMFLLAAFAGGGVSRRDLPYRVLVVATAFVAGIVVLETYGVLPTGSIPALVLRAVLLTAFALAAMWLLVRPNLGSLLGLGQLEHHPSTRDEETSI